MGLLDKAKSYREKLILQSLQGENNLFSSKPVTIEDLKILKEYYEKKLESSISTDKFGLINLLMKVVEDIKYFSSVESIASSLYTIITRLNFDVQGIGYFSEKLDVIYGEIEDREIPTFFGVNYYTKVDETTFFKVSGEMGTFLVVKAKGNVKLDEDAEMILRKCIDVLSISLRLIQFRGFEIGRFWGARNALALSQLYAISSSNTISEEEKVIMTSYYLKELFGLNFVIVFDDEDSYINPRYAMDFPIDAIGKVKISPDMIGNNINNMEVVDLEMSKFFVYGSQNIAFVRFKNKILCIGANYNLSFVISMLSSM